MKELKEVEKCLIEMSKKFDPGAWIPEEYIGSAYGYFQFLNIKVPHIRKAQKSSYSFAKEAIEKQWEIWTFIWKNTAYFEAALSAAHFVNSRPIEELYEHRVNLIQWQKRVDNWALSDELSNVYSRLLEYDTKSMLPVFEKWNSSEEAWEKRQSMVGLLFYSRFRKKTLTSKKILSFVKVHIQDEHYYVQKAVGWTLRECWNLYPEDSLKFISKYAAIIPPAGWTAATEKLSKKEKEKLKKIRKAV